MANFVALAAARNWWAETLGVDVDAHGLSQLPRPDILSSGYIHPSAVQAIGMLGLGRTSIQRFARDDVGRLDLEVLDSRLKEISGPAIIVANAGEVNAGDFDPISDMADLAQSTMLALILTAPSGCVRDFHPRFAIRPKVSSVPIRLSPMLTSG